VLKKAGIIVAASAAGILAFTPLAFAGSMGDDGGSHHSKDDKSSSKSDKDDDSDNGDNGDSDDNGDNGGNDDNDDDGDNGGDTKKDNLENECEFSNEGGDVDQSVVGGSGLVDLVGAATGIAANATSQLNTLNCNNVSVKDVIDLDSNNETSRTTETSIEDSGNTEG
jgi:hypothetical protein